MLFERISAVELHQLEYSWNIKNRPIRNLNRFLIIDDIIAYHIGASIKDAGKKCFGITLLQDKAFVREILLRLNSEML